MDLNALINSITPDIYSRLKRAVEIGRWENGVALTAEQRQQCLQAVIAYDHKNLGESERVGYIEPKKHDYCGSDDDDEWQKIKFQD